jgi:hypothetical protein
MDPQVTMPRAELCRLGAAWRGRVRPIRALIGAARSRGGARIARLPPKGVSHGCDAAGGVVRPDGDVGGREGRGGVPGRLLRADAGGVHAQHSSMLVGTVGGMVSWWPRISARNRGRVLPSERPSRRRPRHSRRWPCPTTAPPRLGPPPNTRPLIAVGQPSPAPRRREPPLAGPTGRGGGRPRRGARGPRAKACECDRAGRGCPRWPSVDDVELAPTHGCTGTTRPRSTRPATVPPIGPIWIAEPWRSAPRASI